MVWSPSIPPAPVKPAVAGWFAVIHILAAQAISMSSLATVIGVIAAAQSLPVTNSAAAKSVITANQTVAVNDSAINKGVQTALQSFSLTNSALSKPSVVAPQSLTITDLATVVGVATAQQQAAITNQGLITGIEAILVANQTVPIISAAAVKGLQTDGQVVAITSAATYFGKPGASQVVAVTDSATTKGYAAANVSIVITTTGSVYARINATQSFSVTSSASFYGKPAADQSFTVTNSATAELSTSFTTFQGSGKSQGSGTITIPSHQAGDAIIIFIANGTNSIPTVPGAGGTVPTWTTLDSATGNNYGWRCVGTIATASNHTSGTFGPTPSYLTMMVAVVRGAYAAGAVGGSSKTTGGSGSSGNSLAFTPTNTDGTSQFLYFWCSAGGTTFTPVPSGYTLRQAQSYSLGPIGACLTTKDVTTSDGAYTQGFGIGGAWHNYSVEIKAY